MHFSLALCRADIFWLYRGLLIKLSWAYMVLLCYTEGQKKPNQTLPQRNRTVLIHRRVYQPGKQSHWSAPQSGIYRNGDFAKIH